jgi:endonuclease/exonuclease/phosphatase (EEP) superfamily protein YafD
VLVAPVFVPRQGGGDQAGGAIAPLRLVYATLDRDNSNPQAAADYAHRQKADLLGLLEVTPQNYQQLQAALPDYAPVASNPVSDSSYGTAWFVSKQRLAQDFQVGSFRALQLPQGSERPALQLTLKAKATGADLSLLIFQAIRPRSPWALSYKTEEMETMGNWSQAVMQTSSPHVIVVGDFNSTPWDRDFRRALDTKGLLNSQSGFGVQPTWPSILPAFLRIPIDHCLHSPSFVTRQREVGPNIGSDHLPIFVELQWNLK